jgi:hypothetical protein
VATVRDWGETAAEVQQLLILNLISTKGWIKETIPEEGRL